MPAPARASTLGSLVPTGDLSLPVGARVAALQPADYSFAWDQERQVAPATASPAQAHDFVERPLIQPGLVHLVGDIRLVVSELVTHAVVHAGTSIRVRIEELPSCVKLTVYDRSVNLPVL